MIHSGNNQAGNGGFLDLTTGQIKAAGVGGTSLSGNVENSLNFAPRLSVAYKVTGKLVVRANATRCRIPPDSADG